MQFMWFVNSVTLHMIRFYVMLSQTGLSVIKALLICYRNSMGKQDGDKGRGFLVPGQRRVM